MTRTTISLWIYLRWDSSEWFVDVKLAFVCICWLVFISDYAWLL